MSSKRNPRLEAAGKDIVTKLKGNWHEGGGMCLCPCHKDNSPSLSVRVGDHSLLFKCFAGCWTIDILRELRRMQLDVPTEPADGSSSPATDVPDLKAERAREIWSEARSITGGLADRYLTWRGLSDRPAALRFHPRTPLGPRGSVRFRPAIIAAVEENRRVVGIQRLFLNPDGDGLATDMEKPKLTLGRPQGGAVQLYPPGPILGLAEGIETAMSAAFLLGIPVWAVLGSERLHAIRIPSMVEQLLLLPDRDLAGRRGVERARAAYADQSFTLGGFWPWGHQNDWSDVLARPALWEERRERGESVRLAA